jgi:hypothetical protein
LKRKLIFFLKHGEGAILEVGWMDGLKVGETKISARGPQPNVHHTDEKLKDQKDTNRQIDRIGKNKKKKKCS